MKTQKEFIQHLINDYYISKYVLNNRLCFEVFDKVTNKVFVIGAYYGDFPHATGLNLFKDNPKYKHLFTYSIIEEVIKLNKIETYTEYELTQNC